MSDNKYDCLTCGACCNFFKIITINYNDYDSLHESIKPFIMQSVPPCNPVNFNMITIEAENKFPRCTALQGVVGEKVHCSVYEHRPPACRSFKPGSILCKKARLEVLNIID